ncbi:hypothetical protein A8A01_14650 [Ewingella americana]|uniref:hypothetical protein n=1 Tax=Yersinia sp. 1252 StPb PI TaxID=3117404 RepID=UPI000C2FC3A4|nr:hypothetical protein A8A01_14650 [Ewingella americana]
MLNERIYDFQTRLNCECVETEIDSSVVALQYKGRDSYQNLDAYLSERRSILQKLTLDDFTDQKVYKRAWLCDRVVIHAYLYPDTRMVDLTFFLLKPDALLHVDVENIVLLYRNTLG